MMDIVNSLKNDPTTGVFYARTAEMAIRLATIRAAGIGVDGGVCADDMRWGFDVALTSARAMVTAAQDYMSEGPHDANKNSLIRLLKARKVPLTMRDFSRHLRQLNPRELAEVVQGAMLEGSVVEMPPPARVPGKTGPASTACRYKLANTR